MFKASHKSTWLIILASLIMFTLLFGSALFKSQTIDEGPHLSAGYSYLATGDWRINPEHPPLVKFLAGLFVLPLNPRLPLDNPAWQEYNQWEFGRAFLYDNTVPADSLLLAGRLPMILISLTLLWLVWYWTKNYFGKTTAALVSLFIVFEPNIIAHGRLITTDVPLTLTFFGSVITFYNYLLKPSTKRLVFAAFIFVLALLTKFSSIILIPTLLIIYLLYRWQINSSDLSIKKFSLFKIIFVYLGITILSIWGFYGFQVQVPNDDPRIASLYSELNEIVESDTVDEQLPFVKTTINIFDPNTNFGALTKNFLESVPIPAYSYWRGLTSVFSHNQTGHGAYLLGEQSQFGWWYYFPIAFLVKVPVSLLIFLIFSLIFIIKKLFSHKFTDFINRCKTADSKWIIITVPPLIYFTFSMLSNINLGVRHILPVFPFVIIMAAWATNKLIKSNIWMRYTAIILLLVYVVSSISIFPHYLTYFNEIVGGAKNGHQILLDSNLDWGQDLKLLKKYIDKEYITDFHFAYFGSADPTYYINNIQPVPNDDDISRHGLPNYFIAISAGVLYSEDLNFEWLRQREPDHIIGHTIYIYDLR
ncbi:ArnT family glycosyltransferase [Patescibacteria group bacterium]